MVLQCLHYNYNSNETCTGSYEQCGKQVECGTPSEVGHHCWVVWQVVGTNTTTISAGCNPPYPSAPDERCGNECIGQPRGPRYYCCCTDNLCNSRFKLPPPVTSPHQAEIPKLIVVDHSDIQSASKVIWSVIPIVLFITIVIAYVYKYRRVVNANKTNRQNRRVKDITSDLNARELNELRSNEEAITVLLPFQNAFDGDNFFNNANNNGDTNINRSNQQQLTTSTNHHDATSCFIKQPNDNRIDLNSVRLLEIIGSGRFGTVHRASTNEMSEIAVKIISNNDYQSWLNETQVYNFPKIRHPNILKFLCSHEHLETESYWLVVEYAAKGSLYNFLKSSVVDWKEFIKIALGIVHGLSHLHEADIAHRDFKSKNILLKHDLTPCITDFGVAAILDSSTGSQLDQRKKYLQVGTPRYMAPEVLECSVTFTKASFTKIDVYALSLVLWELISRCHTMPKIPQHNTHLNHHHPHHQQNHLNHEQKQMAHETISLNLDVDTGADSNDNYDSNDDRRDDTGEMREQESAHEEESTPPFQLPFEDIVGPQPDINRMRQIVVVDKLRPTLLEDWRLNYPACEFCRAIEDGWEYDHDARISASCFVERVESLAQNVPC